MDRASHVILAVLLAVLCMMSVQSCMARRNEFALYPVQKGVQLPGNVRVLLSAGEPCKLRVSGGYEITAGRDVLFADSSPMPEATVVAFPGGMSINNQSIRSVQVDVVPKVDGTLWVNGRSYHGTLQLVNRPDRGLTAVNVLGLEDYLGGVIAGEMPSLWPMPALKAQAIAARTYALYRARSRASWEYDVSAGTSDQVYAGIAGETSSSREAVKQTYGTVLLYDWKILPAYYHAVCGGHTASARVIFGEDDVTPLSGVECSYCNPKVQGLSGVKIEKYYRWQVTVPQAGLLAALARQGCKLQALDAIVPVGPDKGGHAADLEIRPAAAKPGSLAGAAAAQPIRMTVDKFRSLIGYGKLISPAFTCTKSGDAIVISGRGYGHGVGMCQWGARGMAVDGFGTKAILDHYYPGAEIVKVY